MKIGSGIVRAVFGAQMRLECGLVGSLARKYQCSCFVLLLPRRRGCDRIDQGVVHLQGVSEMLRPCAAAPCRSSARR